MNKRLERSIGSLGSRWGIQAESVFRDAPAGILVESFGVEVIDINEFDDEGIVFGRPDQVELDVIIKNGLLIVCELESSVNVTGVKRSV
uniref:PD-(D/E)XK nuclease superfamily protein n=1 Tax=Candidatus Kentrum sp. TC TaxID=2126339 RepID=A0A450YNV8_9GAMM|nr:MAG: PD-(D/E)XK nuclease superfamily protein [Candidatus Kentron sp. TC]